MKLYHSTKYLSSLLPFCFQDCTFYVMCCKCLSDFCFHINIFSFIRSLTTDREKQSAHLASIERALADLRAQVDSQQGAYNAVADRSKNCCINDTALIAAIRDNVNHILAEVCSIGYSGSILSWSEGTFIKNGSDGWGNPLHVFCCNFIYYYFEWVHNK